MDRRSFLRGAGLLLTAPAIVRASSLMPVSVWAETPLYAVYGGPTQADIEAWIAGEALPLARQRLVAYEFVPSDPPWFMRDVARQIGAALDPISDRGRV